MELQSFQRPSYRVFFALFVVFLMVSMHGATLTPFYTTLGLDFQNFHAFFNGYPDPTGRPMIYPPLMIWIMSWCSGISFYRSYLYWEVAILALTVFGTWLVTLVETRREPWTWLVWFLLFFQLPMVYSLERGNNDALVLPIFCGGIYLFRKKRVLLSGVFLAVACWLKVYPVVPCALILAVVGIRKDLRKQYFQDLLSGFFLGGVIGGALFWPYSYQYVTEVLPDYSREHRLFIVSSHSLYRSWPSYFLKLPILVLWGVFFSRYLEKDPVFILTAALAISTFFQGSSNDYSLLTAYPFLFVLMNRFLKPGITLRLFLWLVFSFWVFIGDRTPVEWIFHSRGPIFVHIIWFFTFPVFMMKEEVLS